MKKTTEYIKTLILEQVDLIKDPVVKTGIERFLCEPQEHLRNWDYGTKGETFVCWTVAIDRSSDTSIIYCENGHGPKNPWGMVFTSDLNFGMDSAWFDNLEACYLESFDAGELSIWCIEKKNENTLTEVIEENLTIDRAFEKLDLIRKTDSKTIYSIRPRKYNCA
jgi:hypothetical protein